MVISCCKNMRSVQKKAQKVSERTVEICLVSQWDSSEPLWIIRKVWIKIGESSSGTLGLGTFSTTHICHLSGWNHLSGGIAIFLNSYCSLLTSSLEDTQGDKNSAINNNFYHVEFERCEDESVWIKLNDDELFFTGSYLFFYLSCRLISWPIIQLDSHEGHYLLG